MLIAEDLLLLVLEDVSGRPVRGVNAFTLDLLLGGALVSELALAGAVQLHRNPGTGMLEVHPTGVGIPQDPCLQRCLSFAGGRPRPVPLINSCGTQMFDHLTERLVHQGMLRREQQKRFLITRTGWPAGDISYKQDVRRHLSAILFDSNRGAQPTRRTATLIGHLAAVGQVHRLFVSPGVPPAYVMQRAYRVSREDWVAAIVRGIFRASRTRWGVGGSGGGIGGDWGGGGGDGGGDGGG
ncbi:GPP34 family phosphoprotein [Nocardioides sp. NPDC057767]|uniref:GOLPH3/VPS74 family protein n=1 Tax=unclassified Nocardioides TaxID=2615069 RepID=UPI003672B7FF